MTQTDHNPIWMILTLVVLGVVVVLLAEMIQRDTETDNANQGIINITLPVSDSE